MRKTCPASRSILVHCDSLWNRRPLLCEMRQCCCCFQNSLWLFLSIAVHAANNLLISIQHLHHLVSVWKVPSQTLEEPVNGYKHLPKWYESHIEHEESPYWNYSSKAKLSVWRTQMHKFHSFTIFMSDEEHNIMTWYGFLPFVRCWYRGILCVKSSSITLFFLYFSGGWRIWKWVTVFCSAFSQLQRWGKTNPAFITARCERKMWSKYPDKTSRLVAFSHQHTLTHINIS